MAPSSASTYALHLQGEGENLPPPSSQHSSLAMPIRHLCWLQAKEGPLYAARCRSIDSGRYLLIPCLLTASLPHAAPFCSSCNSTASRREGGKPCLGGMPKTGERLAADGQKTARLYGADHTLPHCALKLFSPPLCTHHTITCHHHTHPHHLPPHTYPPPHPSGRGWADQT